MQEPDGEGKQGLNGHGRLLDHVAAPPDARQEARLGLQRAHRAPGQHAAHHAHGDDGATADILDAAAEDSDKGGISVLDL